MQSAKEQIRQKALDLGLDAVGFTSADPSTYGDAFDQWLASGKYGDMEWMARDPERRKDVQKVLPGAKSIIVTALNYHVPDDSVQNAVAEVVDLRPTSATREPVGVIAKYARGHDYHKLFKDILKQLAGFVEEIGGAGTKAFTASDTTALLEKELAQRAGLAWIGKSTIALNREMGTWFLLGEVITTFELEPDSAAKNRCGTCTRCLDSCPTNAFTGPYQLDARKCIAYLTIELKSDIPEEYRKAIGNRIFGCDDCLAVCPWNRFAQEARAFKKSYRSDLKELDPRDVFQMSEKEFEEKFSGTSLKRLGLERLQRNAAVVLGNVGTSKDLEFIKEKLGTSQSEMVKRHLSWAIDRIDERFKTSIAV
jgi:epoxyqueuosine reductase